MDDALERIARGERPTPEGVDYSDADSWNARFVETWGQSSGEAVLEELRVSKDLFVEAARQVPEEKFEEGRAAYRILTTTGTNHYREHAPRSAPGASAKTSDRARTRSPGLATKARRPQWRRLSQG